MKYLIVLITTFLFGFEVEFNNNYKTTIFPDKKAILLVTKKPIKINYNPKIYTSKGIVLLNYENADDFVRNSLYFNGEVKNINVGTLNIDKIRNKIIYKLNKYYKNCKLKKIMFKDENFKNLYFKTTNLNIKSKVILDCK